MTPVAVRSAAAYRPRVLCVDDEPNLLDALKLVLKRTYDVRTACDGPTALERMTGQLLHAERLATRGTLASGVGHELNNVAAVFQGVMKFVLERAEAGQPPEEEDLRELARIGAHLKTHASHLLNLGRPEK